MQAVNRNHRNLGNFPNIILVIWCWKRARRKFYLTINKGNRNGRNLEKAKLFFDALDTGKGWDGCSAYCHADATFGAQAGALAEIKTLRGLVPICMYCKNIRDDAGFWQRVDVYVEEHSEAKFSHGLCPSCLKEHGLEVVDPVSGES